MRLADNPLARLWPLPRGRPGRSPLPQRFTHSADCLCAGVLPQNLQVQRPIIVTLLLTWEADAEGCLERVGADDSRFSTYQRILNQARWLSLHASRVLLELLVTAFVPTGPLVLGLDNTISAFVNKRTSF
ncbi:hypothetical protein SAMN00790413_05623 [Deinococcus hopiensis KR-140]|uniref:Uncharacterized protein n=1 Tax=Deinococcus hopiensis KR-140 TaxID=695939 RepID=A0A1W1UCG9_9DEIO|nr:hypothetical protein SAMN00790413_05623 [Deinococcus hopiensis KR-140]